MKQNRAPTSKQHDLLFAELGRCLYIFQIIEAMLKMLLPHMVAPGKETTLADEDFTNWRFFVDSKTTLGPLIQKVSIPRQSRGL